MSNKVSLTNAFSELSVLSERASSRSFNYERVKKRKRGVRSRLYTIMYVQGVQDLFYGVIKATTLKLCISELWLVKQKLIG